jgi:lipid-binding SYLF domain-containing protein
MKKMIIAAVSMVATLGAGTALADWDADEGAEYDEKAQVVLAEFLETDPSIQKLLDTSAGYVVIPSVGKAALGIGGARGKGVLYEDGVVTAVITLSQLSFGFQWGGQAYSEFIFFEDDATLENFKHGNYELNAQASAVAVTAGASADAAFNGGMAIFTQVKGGLMYEAAVGGQKFKVEAK